MSRLTRDGPGANEDRKKNNFPCSADHEQEWQPYPVDPYSVRCGDNTYMHTYSLALAARGMLGKTYVKAHWCICTPSLQTGLRNFGKNHKEQIIYITSYQREMYGAKGDPQRTPEDPKRRLLSSED